jgi:hypothetical protein
LSEEVGANGVDGRGGVAIFLVLVVHGEDRGLDSTCQHKAKTFSPAGAQQVLQNRVRLISFLPVPSRKNRRRQVNTKSGLIKSQVCDVIKASLNSRVSNFPFSFSSRVRATFDSRLRFCGSRKINRRRAITSARNNN